MSRWLTRHAGRGQKPLGATGLDTLPPPARRTAGSERQSVALRQPLRDDGGMATRRGKRVALMTAVVAGQILVVAGLVYAVGNMFTMGRGAVPTLVIESLGAFRQSLVSLSATCTPLTVTFVFTLVLG